MAIPASPFTNLYGLSSKSPQQPTPLAVNATQTKDLLLTSKRLLRPRPSGSLVLNVQHSHHTKQVVPDPGQIQSLDSSQEFIAAMRPACHPTKTPAESRAKSAQTTKPASPASTHSHDEFEGVDVLANVKYTKDTIRIDLEDQYTSLLHLATNIYMFKETSYLPVDIIENLYDRLSSLVNSPDLDYCIIKSADLTPLSDLYSLIAGGTKTQSEDRDPLMRANLFRLFKTFMAKARPHY